MVTDGDLTLGGEYTMQYVGDVLQNYTLAAYVILLTNVTSINLIKNKSNGMILVLHVSQRCSKSVGEHVKIV